VHRERENTENTHKTHEKNLRNHKKAVAHGKDSLTIAFLFLQPTQTSRVVDVLSEFFRLIRMKEKENLLASMLLPVVH
jgi:hypothetical protein